MSDETELIAEIEEWLEQGGDPAPPTPEQALRTLGEAFQAGLSALAEALQPLAEVFAELGKKIVEAFARGLVAWRVRQVYKTLRSWHIPRVIASVVAYLWIVKRWPPKTALEPAYFGD